MVECDDILGNDCSFESHEPEASGVAIFLQDFDCGHLAVLRHVVSEIVLAKVYRESSHKDFVFLARESARTSQPTYYQTCFPFI